MFSHSELKGHRAPVTCLAGDSSERNWLVSGSEDRTVRIWDCGARKAVKCLHRCFVDAIEAVALSPLNEHVVFAASGRTIYSFDLRSEGVLCSSPLSAVPAVPATDAAAETAAESEKKAEFSFDEINSMAVSAHERLLAVSDDSANIYLVPFDESGLLSAPSVAPYRTLSRVHQNIVGSLCFNPSSKRSELLSGGFDCVGCVWDYQRCRPVKSAQFQCLESVASTNQVFNPPFVQSISFLGDGKYAACALGDGSIRVSSSKDLATILEIGAHNGTITAMSVCGENIVSGGIDGQVHCWQPEFSKGKGKAKAKASPLQDLRLVWTLNHHSKVNSLFAREHSAAHKDVFVGDVSNVITHYVIR